MESTKYLSENIKAYCEMRGITRRSFEVFCGLSNGTVESWSSGSATPTLKILDRLQLATGIPVGAWIRRGGIQKWMLSPKTLKAE